jgi:hypothetical protein
MREASEAWQREEISIRRSSGNYLRSGADEFRTTDLPFSLQYGVFAYRSPQVTLAFRSFAGYRRAFAEYRMTLKVPFGSMPPVDQPREQRRWNLK